MCSLDETEISILRKDNKLLWEKLTKLERKRNEALAEVRKLRYAIENIDPYHDVLGVDDE